MAPPPRRDAIVAAMPGTVREIMTKAKVGKRTVEKWLAILRAEDASRIVGWQRPPTKGPFRAVHGIGSGKDAHCFLKPISNKVRWIRYSRKKPDEFWDVRRARDGARRNEKRAKAKPNTWFGALMMEQRT